MTSPRCYNSANHWTLLTAQSSEDTNESPCVDPACCSGLVLRRPYTVRISFCTGAFWTCRCRQGKTHRGTHGWLRHLASSGLHEERTCPGVFRPRLAADLRVQSRRGDAFVPARGRT